MEKHKRRSFFGRLGAIATSLVIGPSLVEQAKAAKVVPPPLPVKAPPTWNDIEDMLPYSGVPMSYVTGTWVSYAVSGRYCPLISG